MKDTRDTHERYERYKIAESCGVWACSIGKLSATNQPSNQSINQSTNE